jgi:hypothetical protein
MIKNKEHYQITGDINADYGVTVTNPIIKIAVSSIGVEADGLLKCEYNIYNTSSKLRNKMRKVTGQGLLILLIQLQMFLLGVLCLIKRSREKLLQILLD